MNRERNTASILYYILNVRFEGDRDRECEVPGVPQVRPPAARERDPLALGREP
jgi:hypothetical protein